MSMINFYNCDLLISSSLVRIENNTIHEYKYPIILSHNHVLPDEFN